MERLGWLRRARQARRAGRFESAWICTSLKAVQAGRSRGLGKGLGEVRGEGLQLLDSSSSLMENPELARLDGMKTTLNIPEDELKEAIRHTGAKTKREAVVIALSEFNRRRRLQKLAEKFGTLDDFMTQQELRRMREEP